MPLVESYSHGLKAMATQGTPAKLPLVEDWNIYTELAEHSDDYGIVEDTGDAAASVTSPAPQVSSQKQPALNETDGNNIVSRPFPDDPDDLAAQLENFHIVTPGKINKTRGLKPRPTIDLSTFACPSEDPESSKIPREAEGLTPAKRDIETSGDSPKHSLLAERDNGGIPADSTQWAKHTAQEFDYVLTIPALTTEAADASSNDTSPTEAQKQVKEIRFGCNLITGLPLESENAESELVQTMPGLLSTPTSKVSSAKVDKQQESGDHGPSPSLELLFPSDNHDVGQGGVIQRGSSRRTSEVHGDDRDDVFDEIDEIMSRTPAASPSSRIEDSVEALDKLEEQIEAMNSLTQLERVVSTQAPKGPAANLQSSTAAKRTQPNAAKQGARSVASTVGDKPAGGRATVRHSIAVAPSKQVEKTVAAQAGASKRLSAVSRPASLAPPKPLVRSSKPPTVSTFKLSSEETTRRLKEKTLARQSMSMPPPARNPSRTASPAKPNTATSTKPATRPFELPSAEITRRKQEEREAKLKAEQEEERKRRQFKARPVPASVVAGGTFPRHTAASRARLSLKASTAAEAAAATASTATPSTTKRHSTMGPGMSSRPSITGSTATSSASRGRASSTLSPSTAGLSRATSTSAGSVRGSSVSAEEMREQKMRGKEIFKRESSFVSEKERERRSREEAAKRAREEAAERSKMAAKQWAAKQKARRAATVGAAT
ncbi:hypothetical protein NKR19_g756 [Coniochaeta hoffmannii]|uniref:Carboxylesterase family protein n=1 Tax=Coniochaeta hoffmannii TaxID=91930 RepID=A0AA38W1E1_9PEZI|nr:hypothetical protein NKR19_g756 [Coniochaeta hoffmannii]